MIRWYRAAIGWLKARNPLQRWTMAGALLVLLLAAGGFAVAGGEGGSPVWFGGRPPESAAEQGESDAADSGAGPAAAAAGGKRDQAGSAVSAPPRIHEFADKPGTPERPLPSPTAPIEIEEGNEGCDYSYGDRTICVPWEFPDGVTDGCAWLRERGYKPLKVNGRDRHKLDRNGDGIACGDGD
ncbi:hypothetical protein GCM10022251_52370 [Phytohabitans flavus]|uniref:Uncharacterized protein n=1 Tax=Phytohabitans flavus TaxID=1076124 RepID=A0A6F8Y7I3_9ACTN|nr:excalibur calcium-binding domain-containing protein [Phytohabitans flavus]BCB81983.1 hypothetical protein Pflav_083930 [Phytohabitans flavus]